MTMALVTTNEWMDAFVAELVRLGARAEPALLAQVAAEAHPYFGNLDPAQVAQTEWQVWPPDGFFDDTLRDPGM
ncbi:MAG: hypothetical protein ABI330_12575 [Caldimonas sp.]